MEGSPTQRSLTKGNNEERVCEFWQIIIIYRQIVVKITLKGKNILISRGKVVIL